MQMEQRNTAAGGPGSDGDGTGRNRQRRRHPAFPAGRWRCFYRRQRLVLVGLAAGILALGWSLAGWYALTKQPLAQLPGVRVVTKALPPHYVFSLTGITTPEAVAVTPDGQRIYVVESGGDRLVRAYDAAGRALATLAPPATSIPSRLPLGIAVAPDGRIFVSDRLRGAVDMYTPEGTYIGAFRPEAVERESWFPLGLSFDSRGRLLIADHQSGRHRVLVFRNNEYLDGAFGGLNSVEFSYPYGAAVDSEGRVYVSDSNNARIVVFSQDGKVLGQLASADPEAALGLPRGVAVDPLDRLHVVDVAAHTIRVYQAGDTPSFLFRFGELGTNPGEFRHPNGIALDQRGRVYIADRDNNTVHVWSY